MALTRTSLAADCTASDLSLSITSTSSGFPAVGVYSSPAQILQVGGEYMLVQVVPVSGTCRVMQRGYNGTAAVAHDILSPVITSSDPQDFAGVPVGGVDSRPPYVDDVLGVGENGTIACPTKDTTYVLTKGSALASTTLGTPTKAQDGLRVTVTSATAFAHVITATMEDGTTGGSTTATFTAFVGASMILEACNAIWNVIAVQNVTIT